MAEIICVIGNKGGTGKTTVSHLLGHGLGLLGIRAAVLVTDTGREVLSRANRRYLTADARTPELMRRMVDKLQSLKGWVGVVDGGGSRTGRDRNFAEIADLVLLPFRDSAEDIRTVIQDLERIPGAYALPSQWPVNPWQKEAADRLVAEMLSDYPDRLLEPVPAVSSSKLLLQEELPDTLPTPLNNAARGIAWQVIELLGLGTEAPVAEPAAAAAE